MPFQFSLLFNDSKWDAICSRWITNNSRSLDGMRSKVIRIPGKCGSSQNGKHKIYNQTIKMHRRMICIPFTNTQKKPVENKLSAIEELERQAGKMQTRMHCQRLSSIKMLFISIIYRSECVSKLAKLKREERTKKEQTATSHSYSSNLGENYYRKKLNSKNSNS